MPGRIPRQFIDDLLARTDIIDVVDRRVPLTRAGKEHKARCPFHDERTASFTVNQSKQFYHCFGCGAHGTAISFLMNYGHLEFVEAVEELAALAGLPVPHEAGSGAPAASGLNELLAVVAEADRWFRSQLRNHPSAASAIQYLKKRGLSGALAARFGLGFAPDGWDNLLTALGRNPAQRLRLVKAGLLIDKARGEHYDRFRNRVMFPIADHRGRVVAFGGRVLDGREPKYLNSPQTPLFHKGQELYGLYAARGPIKTAGSSIVVEGYMDVVALAQFGIDNAVATLGTATTHAHLDRLFRLAPRITFCFDGDRAGRDAARKALHVVLPDMLDGREVSFLFLPDGEDPDSLVRASGADALRARIEAARPLPDYLIDQLLTQTDITRLDGRARLVELAREPLRQLPAGVLRELLIDRFAGLARMERSIVATRTAAATESMPRPATHGTGRARLSPLAHAVSLLVQWPWLAGLDLDDDWLADEPETGVRLLGQLLDSLRAVPAASSAALVERFRDTEWHRHLEKLASWPHLIDDVHAKTEFCDTLRNLHRRHLAQQIEGLLAVAGARTLSSAEQRRLTALVQARQTLGGNIVDAL